MINKGQVIIAAVFVIVIVAMLGMIAASMLSTESFSVAKNLHGIQALNAAEGGIRFTIVTSLAADADWSDNNDFGPVSLNPGTFSVHYVSKAKKSCILEVTGIVSGVSRTVRVSFKKDGLPYQLADYGIYAGNPSSFGFPVTFFNNTKIVGNFFYYGPVWVWGDRPPPCQTDGAIRSSSIWPFPSVGIPNYYASWEAVNTIEVFPWDNTYYDNWLTVASSYAAESKTLTGTDELKLNGGTRWFRNVTMRNDSTIIGPGTICATANPSGGFFTTYNNARFIGPVRIIARGGGLWPFNPSIQFNNDTSWTATPEIIAQYTLELTGNVTTPANSILYSRGNWPFGFSNKTNAIVQGSVLAPYGQVLNQNNAQIKGLVYANAYVSLNNSTLEGGAIFIQLANFFNNSMVIQNPDLIPSPLPPGVSAEAAAGFEMWDWGEVY